jgi:hypothetical protein
VLLKFTAAAPGEIRVLLVHKRNAEAGQLTEKLDEAPVNRPCVFDVPRRERADDALQLWQRTEVRQRGECDHLVRLVVAEIVIAQEHPGIEGRNVPKIRTAHVLDGTLVEHLVQQGCNGRYSVDVDFHGCFVPIAEDSSPWREP